MRTRIGMLGWLVVALSPAACGSNGGGTDATDEGTDAEPDAAEVEPDVADDGADGDVEELGDQAETRPPLDLQPGEVVELEAGADGSFTAELGTPGDARQFGLVLYSAAWVNGKLSYTLSATGAAAARLGEAKADPFRPPAERHHLLTLVPELARQVREGTIRPVRDPLPRPTVGERRNFQISDPATARGVLTIEGECIALGTNLAAWIDRTTAGSTDPPAATLDGVMTGFDDTLLPREQTFFGDVPDIDTDGVVNLLWSPIVADAGASAYFYPCDMFDSAAMPVGCDYSNEQEILYAAPAEGRYGGTPAAILETVSHELQHLIYFDHKVILGGTDGSENVYIMEGWAAMGEDLTGYGRAMMFMDSLGLDSSDEFGAIEFLRDSSGYDATRDGMLRAASYLFVRYLYDRAGGDRYESGGTLTDLGGIAWAHETIDSVHEGRANFESSSGAPIDDLLFDWYTALLLTGREEADGVPLSVEPRFTYLPQTTDPVTDNPRGFDPFASFGGRFSLNGPKTVTVATADGEIPGTGNELVILEADGTSPRLSVSVTGGERTALRVRVVRLR